MQKVIGPTHDTTTNVFDSLYLSQVRDAKGQWVTRWMNALGLPDSIGDPTGAKSKGWYDADGNITRIVSRRGKVIRFTYDSLEHLVLRIADKADSFHVDTTWYSLDPTDHFFSFANAEATDTSWLDKAGRLQLSVSCRSISGLTKCFRDSSSYNIRDQRS